MNGSHIIATRAIVVTVTLDGASQHDIGEAFARLQGRVQSEIPKHKITLLNGHVVKVVNTR